MIQIRNNIFETNSSSVHAICIAKPRKKSDSEFPSSLNVDLGQYGWEFSVLNTPEDRASYMYTIAKENGLGEQIKQCIFDLCSDIDVDVNFDLNSHIFPYVDHASDGRDFVMDMLKNKRKFSDFLFGVDSCVFTGNDNSEHLHDMDADVKKWRSENPSGVVYWK